MIEPAHLWFYLRWATRSLPVAPFFLTGLLLLLLLPQSAFSQNRASIPTSFLEEHCHKCHDAASAKGGLNLESLSRDLSDSENMRSWSSVFDRLARGEMPPQKAKQPPAAARERTLQMLSSALTDAHKKQREVVLRRLNRVEYEHTVRDLFGIDVFVQEILPEDISAHGFDTIGASLAISTEQMEAYLEAADVVLDATFGPPRKPERIRKTVNLRDSIGQSGDDTKAVRITEEGVVLFNSGYNPSVLRNWQNPGPGRYRLRIKAKAVQSDHPVTMLVYAGVWGRRDKHIAGFFDVPPGRLSTIELIDRVWERNDTFEIYPFDTIHWQKDASDYNGPGLFVGDIEIEGPLEEWPPPSRTSLLGDCDPDSATLDDAKRILSSFLPRAYRRPVTPDELEPLLALVHGALEMGKPFEQALRLGLKGILCSPGFLFLEEPGTKRVNDHALAARLSYFLWSSMPDPELALLAARGELRSEGVLGKQVERMLNDRKAQRFTENFTGQWLNLREIDFTLPDQKLYPDYDELLKRSMVEESHLFFREILDRNLSLRNFIDSDFTFLNERLARHYRIDGVVGQALRKVTLPHGSVRGGVLTQAAVLKVTANGTTTSPVMRGVWVLDNILGSPSPPPPPGLPAVEPDIRGATTIREQLDKHRESASCARCHRNIDPPGFALESFDVIGGWRDHYRTLGGGKWLERDTRYPHRHVQYRQGLEVESHGVSPHGAAFDDIRAYKRLLLGELDEVTRCLVEKTLTYSLGRGLGFSDRPEVAKIAARVKEQNHGFRTLIHEVVQSDAFQSP